ncbi:MAG: metalloprotease TldD [Alphaproteobacteria bacterium]|nr:metalloprotease TldD [Hyphomonas sp.]MBR9807611.1 metalloprotease TldD [Alphaproteobacteria bacterium]|tara:strand:- start:247 stop:1650 length:1404 start_codon:yes stop_codon:yes gene_type:complete
MTQTPLPFDLAKASQILSDATQGADDGDLFIERSRSESFVFDDGRLKSAAFDTDQGFGLRVVAGESTGSGYASELSLDALKRAASTASQARRGHNGKLDVGPTPINRRLYEPIDPTAAPDFSVKTGLLAEIDAWTRAYDPRVVQVSVSLAGSHKEIDIIRPDGATFSEVRPLVRLNVSVTLEENGRRESAGAGAGGRAAYEEWIQPERWQQMVKRAIQKASVNLQSIPTPAGKMEVVLGPGWPAVLLHEAVGHGLEGDFNRKGTSVYAGRIGEQVAAKGVTVIDDGSIEQRRGSLSFDDEGTPTQRTVLIEDGILKGYMQDRLNARLMGQQPTGNGRRESYEASTMPRMTNTVMLGGDKDPEEIVSSIKRGLWAVDFGGGQVDITSGNFVFQCTEAYLVEDGKVVAPVKNATLIGHGPTVLQDVTMIGNDFAMDDGVGVCGKAGQSVPVGVGQPTLKVGALTVGGAG